MAEDRFGINLGRLLLAIHRRDRQRFESVLSTARREVMESVAAACKESYSRAYPFVTRLHILHEVADGFSLADAAYKTRKERNSKAALLSESAEGASPTEAEDKPTALEKAWGKLQWDKRAKLMSASDRQQSTFLAVRR